ncbi:hypothetical protein PDE_08030 [Penicillium oxalicum 114-2]|uniref:Uncharacterized protein n=1 Tax=Penicillium oxalicum (strain 114-2 / CGMCC 5302) TaxID=933388 RepID=S8B2K9_PENO1|nr:hypothetical protein PDE_08030 [Penicillium oxalicum 114-2]
MQGDQPVDSAVSRRPLIFISAEQTYYLAILVTKLITLLPFVAATLATPTGHHIVRDVKVRATSDMDEDLIEIYKRGTGDMDEDLIEIYKRGTGDMDEDLMEIYKRGTGDMDKDLMEVY